MTDAEHDLGRSPSEPRFAVVGTRHPDDWHTRALVSACERRDTATLVVPGALSVDASTGEARVLADGRTVLDWDVWVLSRPLGRGSQDHQLTALRALGTERPVLNPVDALLTARDKTWTAHRLATVGVPLPPTVATQRRSEAVAAAARWQRVVLKPPIGTLGAGVVPVRCDDPEFDGVLDELLAREGSVIVQPNLVHEGARATDLRLFVVDGAVCAAIRREAPEGEPRIQAARGATAEPMTPPRAVANIAIAATRALGLVWAGVDLMQHAGSWVVLEVNGLAHWRPILEAGGGDMAAALAAAAARRACRNAAELPR